MSELVFREKLLEVRALLGRKYQPYARMLPESCRPEADWLNMELLPGLVLLPVVFGEGENPNIGRLAGAMELSFLAGRIHDLAMLEDGMLARSILCGDYLYAAAGLLLSGAGYEGWLGRVGKVLCRRSEGKIGELGWAGRAYIPPKERVAALHKQNAEGFALAAEMAVEGLHGDLDTWPEFGYYVGILQGMALQGLTGEAYSKEYGQALEQAVSALAGLPRELALAAREHILRGLGLRQLENGFSAYPEKVYSGIL